MTLQKQEHKSVKTELKEKRAEVLDQMSTFGIFGYVAFRHRVYLLSAGLVLTNVLWLVNYIK